MSTAVITLPVPSGVVTTILKLIFDIVILYIIEQTLDTVEARVARRTLVKTGRYRYRRRKIRLPVVGRLDIGGDAQIRAKRRFIVFISLFAVTAVLDLNINGKSAKVTRELKESEVGANDVVIRPRKPLTDLRQIRERLVTSYNDFDSEWKTVITARSPTLEELESLARTYLQNGVSNRQNGTLELHSLLGGIQVQTLPSKLISPKSKEKTIARRTWIRGPMKLRNDRVDVFYRDEFNSLNEVVNLKRKGFQSCFGLTYIEMNLDAYKNYQKENEFSSFEAVVSGRNNTMVCNTALVHIHTDSLVDLPGFLYCARTQTDIYNKPRSINYYAISFFVNMENETMRINLTDVKGMKGKHRFRVPDSRSTCYEIGSRSAAYPIPLQKLQESYYWTGAFPNDVSLFLPYWYSMLEPTKNISGFVVLEGSREVTEIGVISFGIWLSTVIVSLTYVLIAVTVSLRSDKLGENIELDLEEAAHIAGSWRSEALQTGGSYKASNDSMLLFNRVGPTEFQLTTFGDPISAAKNDLL